MCVCPSYSQLLSINSASNEPQSTLYMAPTTSHANPPNRSELQMNFRIYQTKESDNFQAFHRIRCDDDDDDRWVCAGG